MLNDCLKENYAMKQVNVVIQRMYKSHHTCQYLKQQNGNKVGLKDDLISKIVAKLKPPNTYAQDTWRLPC